MYVVDANVLLYAINADAPQHADAAGWLDEVLTQASTVGFPWLSLLAFLRVSTDARLFDPPLSVEDADEVVDDWLACPPAVVLEPGDDHRRVLIDLLAEAGTAGNLVNDVHLAALAIEHEAEIVSFDRDFARLPSVRWRLPGA